MGEVNCLVHGHRLSFFRTLPGEFSAQCFLDILFKKIERRLLSLGPGSVKGFAHGPGGIQQDQGVKILIFLGQQTGDIFQ